MISKSEVIDFYSVVYFLTFNRDKSFFYDNDSLVIYTFLKEKYWGDDLRMRLKLLVKLLCFDASVNSSEISKKLIRKSDELREYLNQSSE